MGRINAVAPLAVVLAALACSAFAQTYPAKPIRMVVPSSPGGGTDIIARITAPRLSERLGQQVVVENRAGAGTMIGGDVVAKAPADGYTLLMATSTLATNPVIYRKVPYNALTDFAPVTLVFSAPNLLVVHPSLPVKTVKELIWFAQARPGQINYASAGLGTGPHLGMELFMSMAKVKMAHIPYKGSGPALVDLIAGHVVTMVATMISGSPHVRAGRLRGLGVTGLKRNSAVPGVPTIDEAALPGFEAVQWYGLLGPAQTPREIVNRLNKEMVTILQLPDVKERFAGDGGDPSPTSPEDFGRYIRAETEKWQNVAKAAGIKPE